MTTAILADDEPFMRAALRERLARLWPELQLLQECEDGIEALQAIQRTKPERRNVVNWLQQVGMRPREQHQRQQREALPCQHRRQPHSQCLLHRRPVPESPRQPPIAELKG